MKKNLKVGDKVAVNSEVDFIEKFEEGKTYVFDKETWCRRYPHLPVYSWVDECDGGVVDVTSSDNGWILLPGCFAPYTINPAWCKEVKDKPKHTFKVGDRVKIRQWDDMEAEFGLTNFGSINCMCKFTTSMSYLCGCVATITHIEYDGVCRLNFEDDGDHTWHMYSTDMIEHYKNEKIVIYRTGNKVVAKDTITGNECYSRCHPDDEFDFNIGAKLAFDRLVGNVEPKPEPKYYNGKVICIEGFCGLTTKGKIYEFVNGHMTFDDGEKTKGRPVTSIEDINGSFTSKFIEVVE